MKKILLLLLPILLIAGCENNSTQSNSLDIIGNWIGTEVNRDEFLIYMNFTDNIFFYSSIIDQDTLETMEADYFINQNINPKQIDIIVKSAYINEVLQNSYLSLTSLGIYEITLDTLILAVSEPGVTVRPINFEQGLNENNQYYARVFKLIKQ
tara:strand:- start:931 stop:1389 length:459 start_codon:yes stop_codon:yes gene_type:complete